MKKGLSIEIDAFSPRCGWWWCGTCGVMWSVDFLCRLSHFEYVKVEDLEKIGMGKPAIRRLMDIVKKKKPKKSILDKVTL